MPKGFDGFILGLYSQPTRAKIKKDGIKIFKGLSPVY